MLPLLIWATIGGLAGAAAGWQWSRAGRGVLDNVVDGVLGGCVAGGLVHRWDASQATSAVGLAAALCGGILFVLLMDRLRPA